MRQNKREQYNGFFQKYRHDARKLRQGINEIINTKTKTKFMPTSIEIEVDKKLITITDEKQIANTFNQHYTTIAENQGNIQVTNTLLII